jgi:hypothetical protein
MKKRRTEKMLQKEYTVVKYTAEDHQSWGLKKDKEYAVETSLDFVDKEDFFVTVWSDNGHLAEMYDGEYQIVAVDEARWWSAKPVHTYVEQF